MPILYFYLSPTLMRLNGFKKRDKETKKDSYNMKVCSVSHWGIGMNMMKIESYHILKNLKKLKS